MKKLTTLSHLPLLVLMAGLTGSFARAMMQLLSREETGLLARENPLQLLCWVLSGAVVLCLWLALKKQDAPNDYASNFPQNTRMFSISLLAAAGILISVLTDLNPRDKLALVRAVLGGLSALALILIGVLRSSGKRPSLFLYGMLCLFYAAHMVYCYQIWSGCPQIADYCFTVLACAGLTISAYHRCAFCASMGRRQAHLLSCLMTGFFCLMCIPGAEDPWLYLSGGLFFLTDLAMMLPPSRQADTL